MGSVATATPPTTSTPTPVQRPPEKAVQRTAHSSAIGHGLGFGGNGALWAFGTYGWGWAAAIGGATVVGMGAKHLRNRRRGGRGGGLFGGGRGGRIGGSRGGLLGRLGGRGRSGGGLGLGGGRGRSGGLGSRAGRTGSGFLGKLAGKRSSTPKGGGGLPGRGAKAGGLLGRGKGGGLLGAGRGKGLGSRMAGAGRGKGGSLLGGGGSRGSRGRGGGLVGGSRSRSGRLGLGGSRGQGSSAGGLGGIFSRMNPFGRRNRRGAKEPGIVRGIGTRARRLFGRLNPFSKKTKPKGKKERQETAESAWTEVPLNPNRTKWKDREVSTNTPPPVRKKPPPPPVSRPSQGGGGRGGITAAAEQFASTLSKPPRDVNLLKNFDEDLGDLAGAVAAIQGGMRNHTALVEAGMPAETAAHQELGRITQQLGQAAESLNVLQAEQRRRNASDHERVDNGRPNEGGYDHKANNNR